MYVSVSSLFSSTDQSLFFIKSNKNSRPLMPCVVVLDIFAYVLLNVFFLGRFALLL